MTRDDQEMGWEVGEVGVCVPPTTGRLLEEVDEDWYQSKVCIELGMENKIRMWI